MGKEQLLAAAVAAGAIGAVAAPTAASADNIVLNQWYTGTFTSPAPMPLAGGPFKYFLGTNGPVLPGGFANAVSAPAVPWTITLSGPGRLTVTDVEASGDQFQMFDNGVAMTPAPGIFHGPGQNPGQMALAGGFTSASTVGAPYDAGDINAALGNNWFSSGTFYLDPGVNNITGIWLLANNQGTGDMNFIAESGIPEPSTWAMLLFGFVGLGFAGYRKARATVSIA
jgi:PEP-CTERM motif